MKILISACVYGENVRWNGTNRLHQHIHEWASTHGYQLVPICPEDELFGTPRAAIRLRAVNDEIKAFAGKQEVYSQLLDKTQEIAKRHQDAVGFIGISRSPTCGLSTGVKDYGSTIKAPMHQAVDFPSTEISSMNTEANRQRFLDRVKKYEKKYKIKKLHNSAISSGSSSYKDPDTGFSVMTSKFLESRGSCCGSGCRHCPWEISLESR